MTDKTNDAIPRAWVVQADNGGPKMFMLEPEAPNFNLGTPAAPAAPAAPTADAAGAAPTAPADHEDRIDGGASLA